MSVTVPMPRVTLLRRPGQCTQQLAAGRGTDIGLQRVNDDQSAQRDKHRRV